jgi:hypothetical protein
MESPSVNYESGGLGTVVATGWVVRSSPSDTYAFRSGLTLVR